MKPYSKAKYTTFKVQHATTLLPFIEQALHGISRNKAKAILSGGGVRVNQQNVSQHDFSLSPGMVVEISKQKPKAEFYSKFVKIVYEDAFIVVIEKNVGILSMAIRPSDFCVKTELDKYFRRSHQKCTAHVVHRLDRETSGLMVYAKTMEAEQILEHNWREIVTDRRYIALVSGAMTLNKGKRESWLKDNKDYITTSSPVDNGGKYALTYYKVLRKNERYSLVELKLATGRKNQIRVHLQDMGHPVCGDIKYGNGSNPCGRLCLHAYRLDFYHPMTSKHLHFESAIPKDFNRVLHSENDKLPMSDNTVSN